MNQTQALPLVAELESRPIACEIFRRLAHLPHCVFLDSALRHPTLGRYSFIAADPFDFLQFSAEEPTSLEELDRRLSRFGARPVEHLPPFQGGAAGLFGYDLNRSLERIARPRFDEFQTPAVAVGLYDVLIAFDHQQDRAWIISQGFPETEPQARRERAAARLAFFCEQLETGSGADAVSDDTDTQADVIPADSLAPQFRVSELGELTSNFSPADFRRAIRRVVDYIYAGDAFQVNLAQRLLHPSRGSSIDLYLRLRERNPATFAGYFDLGDFQIVSASPERFLQVQNGWVETRPIKGTRQRTLRPEADLMAGDELLSSEKDRAENVMIVDLLRNDLSRVCDADTVQVTQLCRLEVYQYVQHLVSAVCGRMRDGATAIDLLRATFPGGSITGAPKVRAMEIIAELEPTARGPYCGSLGYIGFDGAMDTSILIRTITAGGGWWQMPVGGGIVAQSHPDREYEETWHKARGMLQALQ